MMMLELNKCFQWSSEGAVQDKKTLRDYFAAKAMQAVISRNKILLEGHWHDRVAIDAFAMADAMLAQRER